MTPEQWHEQHELVTNAKRQAQALWDKDFVDAVDRLFRNIDADKMHPLSHKQIVQLERISKQRKGRLAMLNGVGWR